MRKQNQDSKSTTLVGEFVGLKHVFDDAVIAVVDLPREPGKQITAFAESETVKGPPPFDGFKIGQAYRFVGKWTNHFKHGKQFAFTLAIPVVPYTKQGVVAYLQKFDGIGPVNANKLWDEYGADVLEIVITEPGWIARIAGINWDLAVALGEAVAKLADTERQVVELTGLFDKRGFPRDLVKTVCNDAMLQPDPHGAILADPYKLLNFSGCGWKTVDALYLDLGHDPSSEERQARVVYYAITSDTNGSVWFDVMEIRAKAFAMFGPGLNIRLACELARDKFGLIQSCRDGDRIYLADRYLAISETAIAENVVRMESGKPTWGSVAVDAADHGALSQHQAEQLCEATTGRLGVLTGTGGTGKTRVVGVFVRELVKKYGANAVAVWAPTGKAAVRVTRELREWDAGVRATTIHTLLRVDMMKGLGHFIHGEHNPLPHAVIVVDEMSMVDTPLCAALLSAIRSGGHVLIVGDWHQLAPVGPGSPLRDLIDAGVPSGELTQLHRNAGMIAKCCATMRETGRLGIIGDAIAEDCNLAMVETLTPLETVHALRDALNFYQVSSESTDVMTDVQVLVAVNEKSEVARVALNGILQATLNPRGARAVGNPFRAGDKVICLKNAYYYPRDGYLPGADVLVNEDGHVYVANGEQGIVTDVSENWIQVKAEEPFRWLMIPRKGGANVDGCKWTLAYAISVHKSQGSQWPITIIVIDDYAGARWVCSRNWLFTAISRSSGIGYLIGKKVTAERFCLRDATYDRRTRLVQAIGTAREKEAGES